MSEGATMIRSVTSRFAITCYCLCLSLGQSVTARTSEVAVNVSGVILAPAPCIVNGNNTLTVPFGSNLVAAQIDGVNYRKQVPYTVTCGPQPTNDMTIELQGGGASFDRALLMTSKSNLGIKFLVGGATWSLNSPVNFTYPTLPQMEAVLVAKPGSTLAGGVFSASATIVISLR